MPARLTRRGEEMLTQAALGSFSHVCFACSGTVTFGTPEEVVAYHCPCQENTMPRTPYVHTNCAECGEGLRVLPHPDNEASEWLCGDCSDTGLVVRRPMEREPRTGRPLPPPFPFFGAKRSAAPLVWAALGDPDCYIEPFAGSLAVLLARPHVPRVEIACDLDGLIMNFWRALRADWRGLVEHDFATGPVSEDQIEALHHLVLDWKRDGASQEMLRTHVDYYRLDIAAAWWAGQSAWLGSGWARLPNNQPAPVPARQRPHIDRTLKGLYAQGIDDTRIIALASRLAGVELISGDWVRAWSRSCSSSIVRRFRGRGGVGVFLDPPYSSPRRHEGLYTEDAPLASEILNWIPAALDEGARIVLAGYDDEYPQLDWERVHWSTPNGYAGADASRRRHDVLHVSPNCDLLAVHGLIGNINRAASVENPPRRVRRLPPRLREPDLRPAPTTPDDVDFVIADTLGVSDVEEGSPAGYERVDPGA